MTSIVTPEQQSITFSQVDDRAFQPTTVVAPQQAAKWLVVVWAVVVITGSVLLCLFLMNTACCAP